LVNSLYSRPELVPIRDGSVAAAATADRSEPATPATVSIFAVAIDPAALPTATD
jgi:hypothetical protein